MKKIPLTLSAVFFSASAFAHSGGGLEGYEVGVKADINGLPRVKQELVIAPTLPNHEQNGNRRAENL